MKPLWKLRTKVRQKLEVGWSSLRKNNTTARNKSSKLMDYHKKEQHDGQKTKVKAQLVARGFQEELKPQSDSPTAAKESFKLLMALSANFHFKLASVDIWGAFL